MIDSHELCYASARERYEVKETMAQETSKPQKKVSFFKRFFIHDDDDLIKLTAAVPLDHSFPGNHFNLR